MSLLDSIAKTDGKQSTVGGGADGAAFDFRGRPVAFSEDLARILAIPRRPLNIEDPLAAQLWTKHLRRERPEGCDCDLKWGVYGPDGKVIPGSGCITSFNPTQGWALEEAMDHGLAGNIGVGHGKALALGTKIPTPSGWSTMGDLKVGDQVLDSRGAVCRVTFVTEIQRDRDCFDVVFSDGSVITADADHRWLTRNYLERRQLDRGAKKVPGPGVRTTREIAQTLSHGHNKNHAVDVAGALVLPERRLPLDPYCLGAWLGDGSTDGGAITSMDPEILEAFERAGFARGAAYESGRASTQTFYGLRVVLRGVGVLGNKHVPTDYLRGSAPQRLALLQGLMDTDGSALKDNTVEFCSTLPVLAGAVFELAASLGQQPKVYDGRSCLNGKDHGPRFRVCWQPTINVFRLPRKADRLRLGRYRQSQIKARRYIDSVRPRASVPVRCITVDSPDHTYLCGEAMIPTHNTSITIFAPWTRPDVKTATLLIPSGAKRQFLERDFPQWSAHFKTPNLAGSSQFWKDGRPILKIITYSELSLPKNSDILTRHGVPDMLILDESQNAKDRKGPRWQRIERAIEAGIKYFLFMSGSPTDKSIKEYAHHAAQALGSNSPLPLHPPTLDEWSTALDASAKRAPMGALARLCAEGEGVQDGFARRLSDTAGVVITTGASVRCALEITAIKAPPVPSELLGMIEGTRNGRRPDGEISLEAMTSSRWARQMAAGFFSYWNFPRKEPDALITEWFEKRKAYHKEGREKLKYSREFLDSPLLLWNAAARWHDGYKAEHQTIPPHSTKGPMPVWPSEHFLEWREIRDKVHHETKYKWVSDYLVDQCAAWASKNVGIIWVEHKDFGARLAEKAGIPFYDGGGKNPELEEKGGRPIVCSIKANGTAKNLQHLYHKNLFPNPMSTNKDWEQCLDSKTEILTAAGWRGIDDDISALAVAAFDPITRAVTWEPSKRVERLLGAEEIYGIESPHLSIRVTAGHRMLASIPKHVSKHVLEWSPLTFVNAHSMPNRWRLPINGIEKNVRGTTLSNEQLVFVGLFMTDGNLESNGRVALFQSERYPEIVDLIDSTVRACGLTAKRSVNTRPSNFGARSPLHKWTIPRRELDQFGPWLTKDLCPEVAALTRDQLLSLLWGMWAGDGHKTTGTYEYDKHSPGTISICSKRKHVLEQLQIACVLRGLRACVAQTKKGLWLLRVSECDWWSVCSADDGRPVWGVLASQSSERVWCCTVSTGAIITRRNGKVAIVGNCLGRTHRNGQRADSVEAEVFLHTPEMRGAFDTARNRARYVTNTMKNPQKLCYAVLDLSAAVEDTLQKPEAGVRWWEDE